MFSMASADRPIINGNLCLTKTAFEGSLTATLASGMILPRASPISRAANASRKRSAYGISTHLVQAMERTMWRMLEMASTSTKPTPSRRMPSRTSETPTLLTKYEKRPRPSKPNITPNGMNRRFCFLSWSVNSGSFPPIQPGAQIKSSRNIRAQSTR